MRKSIFLFSMVLGIGMAAAWAQSSELGVVVGAKFTPSVGSTTSPSGKTNFDTSLAFEVSYAARLAGTQGLALQLEVPFTAVPNTGLKTSNLFASKSYSSYYLTPGLRLKLAPSSPLSPWIAAGAGFVHFNPSATNLGGGPSGVSSTTKSSYDVGAGIDFHTKKSPLLFRVQAREFYTGVPNLSIPKISIHNNVVVSGGVVFRF
ncbi:MAG TPA: outer membrane beta-barrel protein [Candidatus Saccharimonadales bacterium]|jgi:opacity protein-like surface antigen|nr:outer membrane beta-barrel protein [Candidatus Saccharimonadales bacterium]